MSATAKLQLRLGYGCQLILVLIIRCCPSKIVKAKAVEGVWVWVDTFVEVDGICWSESKGTSGDGGTVRERDIFEGFALKSSWSQLAWWKVWASM